MSVVPQPDPGHIRESPPASQIAEEQWYLRIDEKVIGPVARAQLEQFLRPPRLCRRMDVMCSFDPECWHRIQLTQTLDDVLALAGIPVLSEEEPFDVEPTVSLTEQFAERWSHFVGRMGQYVTRVREYKGVIAMVLLLVAVNGIAWIWFQDPQVREREILTQYESIWQTIKEFHEGSLSEDDWSEFAQDSLSQLEPTIAELKRTSNVHHPARQNLLYAGQDHLVSILTSNKPPKKGDQSATIFERYLRISQKELGKSDTSTQALPNHSNH